MNILEFDNGKRLAEFREPQALSFTWEVNLFGTYQHLKTKSIFLPQIFLVHYLHVYLEIKTNNYREIPFALFWLKSEQHRYAHFKNRELRWIKHPYKTWFFFPPAKQEIFPLIHTFANMEVTKWKDFIFRNRHPFANSLFAHMKQHLTNFSYKILVKQHHTKFSFGFLKKEKKAPKISCSS